MSEQILNINQKKIELKSNVHYFTIIKIVSFLFYFSILILNLFLFNNENIVGINLAIILFSFPILLFVFYRDKKVVIKNVNNSIEIKRFFTTNYDKEKLFFIGINQVTNKYGSPLYYRLYLVFNWKGILKKDVYICSHETEKEIKNTAQIIATFLQTNDIRFIAWI